MSATLGVGVDLAAYSRAQALGQPPTMTAIPRERLPPDYRLRPDAPTQVWQSCRFLAQLFPAPRFNDIETRRLSIFRVTLKDDGSWEDGITWDELMQVKRECGFGALFGLEIYPRDVDIVNLFSARHLWLFATPLRFGRFSASGAAP
jgi:hypothetical protein